MKQEVQFPLWRESREQRGAGDRLKAEKLFERMFRRKGCPSREGTVTASAVELYPGCLAVRERLGWKRGRLEWKLAGAYRRQVPRCCAELGCKSSRKVGIASASHSAPPDSRPMSAPDKQLLSLPQPPLSCGSRYHGTQRSRP